MRISDWSADVCSSDLGLAALLQLVAAHPFGHQADQRLVGRAEFGAAGLLDAGLAAGVFDHRHLHTEADAEIRHLAFTRQGHRADFAFRTAIAEAARHQDGKIGRAVWRERVCTYVYNSGAARNLKKKNKK